MRLLWVNVGGLWPLTTGGRHRSFNIIAELALGRSWLSGRPLTVWRWQVPALREAAARVLRERRPDVVVADFLYSTPNVPSGDTCTVHFAHNVEHVIWRR